jgi:hypothetical protein
MRRELRAAKVVAEKVVSGTVPAAGQLVIVHRLGRAPVGWGIVEADLGGPITCVARDAESITLANADPAVDAAVKVRVY